MTNQKLLIVLGVGAALLVLYNQEAGALPVTSTPTPAQPSPLNHTANNNNNFGGGGGGGESYGGGGGNVFGGGGYNFGDITKSFLDWLNGIPVNTGYPQQTGVVFYGTGHEQSHQGTLY